MPFDGEAWLVDYINDQVDRIHLNQVILLDGPPGSGKSWTAARLAQRVYPAFSIDDFIIVHASEFVKRVTDPTLPSGAAVVWDDAGLGAPSRRPWDEINQTVGLVMQSFRYLRRKVFITLPDETLLDSQPRKLNQFKLEMNARKDPDLPSTAKPFLAEHNSRLRKSYWKYPRVQIAGTGTVTLKKIVFRKPSTDIVEAYEAKKRAVLGWFYKDRIRRLELGEGRYGTMDPLKARAVVTVANYGTKLGMTQGDMADDLGIGREWFNRLLSAAKDVARAG